MSSYRVIFKWPKDPPNYRFVAFKNFIATTPGLERVHIIFTGESIEMEFRDEETFTLFMFIFDQDEMGIPLTPIAHYYSKG